MSPPERPDALGLVRTPGIAMTPSKAHIWVTEDGSEA
jgi:hypothetical protein